MKKIALLFALTFIVFCSLNATNNNEKENSPKASTENTSAVYQLSGTVYDPNGNEVLPGASITVDGKKYYSDLSGNFNIPQLARGKYIISVNFISYQSQTMEIDLKKDEDMRIAIKQL